MSGHKLKIGETQIFYRDEGISDKNILILHGWGSRSDNWLKVQQHLTDAGFRVVMPDLPGFGQSEEPPFDWGITEYSRFVNEFTKKINLEKFALIGHSFGGRISIDYAVRYPEQLNRLVLVSAAGVVRHGKTKTNTFLALSKIGNFIFSTPILSKLKPLVRRAAHKLVGATDYKQSSDRMQGVMKNILNENLRAFLPRITMPTLILWGENDTMTPVIDAKILNEEIPTSYLHIFGDQPHALNFAIPKQLSNLIIKFLKPDNSSE